MSYRTQYYDAPTRRRTSRWLRRLTIFVWLLVFGCIGLRAFALPAVNNFFNRQVAQRINPGITLPADPGDAVRDAIEGAPLPGVPTLPPGQVTITDDQATGYMTAQAGQFGLSSIEVQFVPGEVVATLTRSAPVLGQVSGTVRADARAEDGRLVLENEQIDGAIGQFVSPTTLVNALEDRLNSEIEQQGREIDSIDIQSGVAVVTIE